MESSAFVARCPMDRAETEVLAFHRKEAGGFCFLITLDRDRGEAALFAIG